VINYIAPFLSKRFMSTNPLRYLLIVTLITLSAAIARASIWDEPLFHSTDSLAPRDEWGVLHQTPHLNRTDYYYRDSFRPNYYFKSGRHLLEDPAYVGALQVCLRNRGFYCGPIDGVMSEDISVAIARLQKNHTQRVTGTLTVPVRRALFLP
jgi:hypothetical protein